MKSIENINTKISNGTAVIWTASEFKKHIRSGETITPEDVDVVTCGTFGVMSGTAAILAFQAAPTGSFIHACKLTLNGIPAHIGPCPNENNGHVDAMVYGTAQSSDSGYGGGHLFADLVTGKSVEAVIETDAGTIVKQITLSDMSSAKIIITRGAFKNYMAFVNPGEEEITTIFSVLPMQGNMREATFSGCGEINPLENDPELKYHSPGTAALVNGAPGIIIGTGTRTSAVRPNLSLAADMWQMDPNLMGGFKMKSGCECLTSVATAIPVTDDTAIAALSILDENIPLPIANVLNRTTFDVATYSEAWSGDPRISVEPDKCKTLDCNRCRDLCPRGAIHHDLSITKSCMGCLTCTVVCPNHVFSTKNSTLHTTTGNIPIVLRQSDRTRGEIAALMLRNKIRTGEWKIGGPL
ncbi:MAG: methanogenesis marker 16 metalloprotein [Methanocalculaceae archaeon]|jgi:putative methanogenesis marker 16 metalloprotein|nr:methanogenesis marker 16 metalloprotein [Methanocalculaceae archaeon]